MPHNEFLATTREFGDFVLKVQFKLLGTEGFINAGVQLRSQRVPGHYEMVGYQLDLGDPNWWGSLYDESRRNRVLAQSDMAVVNRVLRRGDWNDYEIRCEGRRIVAFINGAQTIDYTEPDDVDSAARTDRAAGARRRQGAGLVPEDPRPPAALIARPSAFGRRLSRPVAAGLIRRAQRRPGKWSMAPGATALVTNPWYVAGALTRRSPAAPRVQIHTSPAATGGAGHGLGP